MFTPIEVLKVILVLATLGATTAMLLVAIGTLVVNVLQLLQR